MVIGKFAGRICLGDMRVQCGATVLPSVGPGSRRELRERQQWLGPREAERSRDLEQVEGGRTLDRGARGKACFSSCGKNKNGFSIGTILTLGRYRVRFC